MKRRANSHLVISLILGCTFTHALGGADHAVDDKPAKAVATADAQKGVDPDDALQMLVDGNRRFTAGETSMPKIDQLRRCETFGTGQHPFATILSCADSRVPPEIVFDQGIGDLFVIRIAGNVADTDELATIEYGAAHLGSRLVVVMGHTKCGAVTAVVDGAQVKGNLAGLLDNIGPAVALTKKQNPTLTGAPLVTRAIRANVFQSIEDLISNSPDLRAMMAEEKIKVVGAVYDIHSGTIDWLGQHPRQGALMAAPTKPKKNAGDDVMHEQTEAHETDARKVAHKDDHKDARKDDHSTDHSADHSTPPKKTVAPSKKPAAKSDVHGDGHSDAHGDAHGDAQKDAHTEITPVKSDDGTKRYVAIGAFAVGAVALSGVVVALMRK